MREGERDRGRVREGEREEREGWGVREGERDRGRDRG